MARIGMANRIVLVICLLQIVIDIVAGILGIQAQVAQNKGRYMRVWIFECREPSYEAYKLGLAASILLAVAHVIANVLGGCILYDLRRTGSGVTPPFKENESRENRGVTVSGMNPTCSKKPVRYNIK
ncbi:hypothetical protein vseg_011311 [Gypsophila vaccaria]